MKLSNRVGLYCLACSLLSPAAFAAYPDKPVHFILPFPPGGGTDTLGRAIGNRLGEGLGQQVVIDNRPGGGANIGADLAAHAPADGYTLFMVTATHAINATLYKNLPYNLEKDFVPVTELGTTAMVVVIHPTIPAKSVKQLIAFAKAHPGKLTHSSSGTGSITQLAGELFKSDTGIRMLHIPYKGGGPSVIALVSGEAAVGFATTPSCIVQIQNGSLVRHAGSGRHAEGRHPAAPRRLGEGAQIRRREEASRRDRPRSHRQQRRRVRRLHPQRDRQVGKGR